MGWLEKADLRDNTPWWVPGVTTGGWVQGMAVTRCNPFGYEDGGPKHLEGGFYGTDALGPHMWHCQARADGRYYTYCKCGHKGQPKYLCSGHVMMFAKRMSGVCPPCVHPPAEVEIQSQMQGIRESASPALGSAQLLTLEGRLWLLQEKLNDLVAKGIVHRCPLKMTEVS